MWRRLLLLAIQLLPVVATGFRGVKTSPHPSALESFADESLSKYYVSFNENARATSSLESVNNSNDLTISKNQRRAQQQPVTVKIINDCGYGVTAGVNYTTPNGSILIWRYIRDGRRMRLSSVASPILYLYGRSDNDVAVWSGRSNLCIYGLVGPNCFRKVNLGSLNSGSILYKACSQTEQLAPGFSWSSVSDSIPPPTQPPISPSPSPSFALTTLQPSPPPTSARHTSPPAPAPASTQVAHTATDLSNAWLVAHNTRRTNFFKQHGLSPRNLKWSRSLAQSAQSYAELLTTLSDCTIKHGYQGNSYGGENLACNWGDNVSLTPEGVLQLWYDGEKDLPFGENLHYYQVAWRGTSYVGCGIANKTLSDGTMCFIQSCRYIAPGNCNVDQTNILQNALQDTSPCTPFCPNEGCI